MTCARCSGSGLDEESPCPKCTIVCDACSYAGCAECGWRGFYTTGVPAIDRAREALALVAGIPLGNETARAAAHLREIVDGRSWHVDSREGARLFDLCIFVLFDVASRS